MIGYIPLYDKYGEDAKVCGYRRVDTEKVWHYMMTHLPPEREAEEIARLCAKSEGDEGKEG